MPGLPISVCCLYVSMSTCLHVSAHGNNGKWKNGKQQLPFFRKQKKETANFRLFAAKGNGKRTFIFLGQQTINGNRRLLLQQTCPSMFKQMESTSLNRAGFRTIIPEPYPKQQSNRIRNYIFQIDPTLN